MPIKALAWSHPSNTLLNYLVTIMETLKKFLPKSAIGQLYVGGVAVLTAIGLTATCVPIVVAAAIESKA